MAVDHQAPQGRRRGRTIVLLSPDGEPAPAVPSRLPTTSSNAIPLLSDQDDDSDETLFRLSVRGRFSQTRRRRSGSASYDGAEAAYTDSLLPDPRQAIYDQAIYDQVWNEADHGNNPTALADMRRETVRSYAQTLRSLIAPATSEQEVDNTMYVVTCAAEGCNAVLCHRARAPLPRQGHHHRARPQAWRARTYSTDAAPVDNVVPYGGDDAYCPDSPGSRSPHCTCKAIRTGCKTCGNEVGFHFTFFCSFCMQALTALNRCATSSSKPAVFFFHACTVHAEPRVINQWGPIRDLATWAPMSSTAAQDFSQAKAGDPVHWVFPSPESARAPLPAWLPYRTDDLERPSIWRTRSRSPPRGAGDRLGLSLPRPRSGSPVGFSPAVTLLRRRPRDEDDDEELSPEEREWAERLRMVGVNNSSASTLRRVRRRVALEPATPLAERPDGWSQADGFDLSFSSNDRVSYGMLSGQGRGATAPVSEVPLR